VDQLLQEAIDLVRNGQKEPARALLVKYIQHDPHNEAAWFWLADCLPDTKQRIQALDLCLKFNPGSQKARRTLENLRKHLPSEPDVPIVDTAPVAVVEPVVSEPPAPLDEETAEVVSPQAGRNAADEAPTQPSVYQIPRAAEYTGENEPDFVVEMVRASQQDTVPAGAVDGETPPGTRPRAIRKSAPRADADLTEPDKRLRVWLISMLVLATVAAVITFLLLIVFPGGILFF